MMPVTEPSPTQLAAAERQNDQILRIQCFSAVPKNSPDDHPRPFSEVLADARTFYEWVKNEPRTASSEVFAEVPAGAEVTN